MAVFNRALNENIPISSIVGNSNKRDISETLLFSDILSKSETSSTVEPKTPLVRLLRNKYEALIGVGVDSKRTYSDTKRKYFIIRSGALEDPQVPTSFYMHTTFDNLSLPEGYLDFRERQMFILESTSSQSTPWQDAARQWALV